MEDKYLEMDQEDSVEYPNSIYSGGMGPCISIGIYDTRKKSGYMRHQVNAHCDTDMELFLKSTLIEVKPENAKVVVAGGAYDVNDKEIVQDARSYIEELVNKYFTKSKNVTFHWVNDNMTSVLHLDTSNGKFRVEASDDNSDEYFYEY